MPLPPILVAVITYLLAGLLVRAWRTGAAASRGTDRRSVRLESEMAPHAHDAMWLFAVVLAAVYFYRTQSDVVLIVAWAVEGLCAAGAGFALGARSFRLSGLVLLGLCVVMTLFRAFTTFDTVGRIVTFLALGVTPLLVSFAYTRVATRNTAPERLNLDAFVTSGGDLLRGLTRPALDLTRIDSTEEIRLGELIDAEIRSHRQVAADSLAAL